MSEFKAKKKIQEAETPRDFVTRRLKIWLSKRGKALPAPCPHDAADCAQWWLQHMQPQNIGEEYATVALLNFLDLSEEDRKFVVAATKDRVFYRGDKIDAFAKIYDETMKLRTDPDSYIAAARAKRARLEKKWQPI